MRANDHLKPNSNSQGEADTHGNTRSEHGHLPLSSRRTNRRIAGFESDATTNDYSYMNAKEKVRRL